jgi:serine/threonine protein kinase
MIGAKQLLDDNYALERVIGCGGSGIVVSARHARLGLRVALKFLRPDRPRTAEVAKRFVREGQMNARIQNAHVTRVLDIGRLPDAEPFLVLEYLEGCDLGALLAARGPLASRDAVAYVRQACAGLASAHAHGVIHRDLRPENLFLTLAPNGTPLVKLLDFGSAQETNHPEECSNNPSELGHAPVVAPEQLRGERRADAKSDIWALGAALFTLLSGRSPFERSYASETYLAILAGRVPDLCALRPDIERPLSAVVERCLAPNPDKRFASAAELGAALSPFSGTGAGQRSVGPRPPSMPPPPPPSTRPRLEPSAPKRELPASNSGLPIRNVAPPPKPRAHSAETQALSHC